MSGEKMAVEFRFEAREGNDGSHDDLRTLYTHLANDPQLRQYARVSVQHELVRPGELGTVEVVLAVVATVVGVGQLAVAIGSWLDALNRPTTIQLVVSDEHRENAQPVFDALGGSGAPEAQYEKADAVHAGTVGNSSMGRIDPANSACVLIGVDRYEDRGLPSLRAVYNNLENLAEVLTNENIWGIKPGRMRVVHNPRTSTELIRPIREMSELATDTLIVYYSGHGLKDLDDNELYLALPDSVAGQPETSVRYKAVKQAIAQSRQAQRVVVILDCCYSGAAIDGGMSAAAEDICADAGVDDVRGSYLMCSAAANRKALAPTADGCTVFTGELVDVLRGGVAEESEPMLRLGVVFRAVRQRLRRDGRPEPQEQDQNQVGDLAFVHNIARTKTSSAEVVAEPRSRRRRALRSLRVAATILLAFSGGLAVQPGIDWWRARHPVSAGGSCSSNVALLSYSDQLDKTEVRGEPVSGLSALALTGRSEGLALADNGPGRVFPLKFENPDDLTVSAGIGRTLRVPDGASYGEGIDGEGIVIESGTGTILVGSEEGPSVHRFQISDGREIGTPLTIPKMLQTAPVGDAQHGRTIESLAATPDGRYLYAGWEGPLSSDGDQRGRNRVRIQRYRGTPGGTYTPDHQYAYETGAGFYLTELAVVGRDRLLALERQYVEGFGNGIRVYDVSIGGADDVTDDRALADDTADVFVPSTLLFDLGACPAGSPGQVATKEQQPNPLLGNVEGMAVGPEESTGPDKGSRLLYLITDDNGNNSQITRLYVFRIRLP